MSEFQTTIHQGMPADEIERPQGRFFNGDGNHTTSSNEIRDVSSEAAQFEPLPGQADWFADYRRWCYGRQAMRAIKTHVETRPETGNEIL